MSPVDTPSAAPAPTDVVAELRRFLELGAAQLDAAMRESDARVDKLATAVSGVAADARALEQAVRVLDSQDAAAVQHARQRIRELTQGLSAHADATVTALQFYDKLIQRLTHVREGLVMPSDSAASRPVAVDWNGLLEQVRDRYSTVEERVLFDFMMRGLNSDQMLKALSGLRASTSAGEFEAF
jgi:hypothetical protein